MGRSTLGIALAALAAACVNQTHAEELAEPSLFASPKAAEVRAPPPPPRAEENLTEELAESLAAAKLIGLILKVKANSVTTRYQAVTEVDEDEGLYAWDCSGMANWFLKRAAPRARRALGKGRPRAIDFYKAIQLAPSAKAKRGWQSLAHIADARPGDVFAFPRSPLSQSKISGHVGFFVETPWKVDDFTPGPGLDEEGHTYEAWAARILDATGLPHENDTRERDSEGGFGFGTFLFVNDESGKTVAYGWFGTRSRGFLPTDIVYGRVAH